MKRVSLWQLLLVIAVVSVGLAAIRSGTALAALLVYNLTLLLLLTGVLGAMVRARPIGAWIGFALFGCFYFAWWVVPLISGLMFNPLSGYSHVYELAEFIHPEPPVPAGVVPTSPLSVNDPNMERAAYAKARKARQDRVENSIQIISPTVCLLMGLVGSIVGRVLEARCAAARPG